MNVTLNGSAADLAFAVDNLSVTLHLSRRVPYSKVRKKIIVIKNKK
jgi:hypothetical protein